MSVEADIWRSRITRTGSVDPAEIIANPANWRQHPRHQREALRDLLGQVGWVQGVVINERSGHLVDGHLRAELAVEDGAPAMPAIWVELSDEEERLVLASLDPLGDLAVADPAALDALLQSISAEGAGLQGLLDDIAAQNTLDDLLGGDGEGADERDFWPFLRLQISRETLARFEEWWPKLDGEDDDAKLRGLIEG